MADESDTPASPAPRYAVRAVERTLTLLDGLGNAGANGASLADLARASGLSEATALRYLATLADGGFAERDSGSGRYRLGLGVLVLGERALGDVDPRPIVLPYMEKLRSSYGHTVNLAAFRDSRIILIEVLEGIRSIRKGAQVGEEDSLHSTALGKAILARLPRERARELLQEAGMPAVTEHTITSLDAMDAELDRVAKQHYAIDDAEGEPGLRCVGVAILDRRGRPAYGLSISAPAPSLSRETADKVGPLLARLSYELSQRLGYQGTVPPRKETEEEA